MVERNYRTRAGEIDLIALDARALVFCEVKARRAGSGWPLESVRDGKRRQVRAMAREWLDQRRPRPYRPELRFDAIGVTLDGAGRLVALEHIERAF